MKTIISGRRAGKEAEEIQMSRRFYQKEVFSHSIWIPYLQYNIRILESQKLNVEMKSN